MLELVTAWRKEREEKKKQKHEEKEKGTTCGSHMSVGPTTLCV
jgi:hypothetical protein